MTFDGEHDLDHSQASITSLDPKTISPSKIKLVLLGEPDSQSFRDDDSETTCGFLCFKGSWLQRFANVQVFTACCTTILFLQSALTSGYTFAVLTTIEKQFEIASVTSGFMASAYEAGNLLTIIFVSHYGGRHVPKWLGAGSLAMSIGVSIFAIPHYIKMGFFRHGYVNIDQSDMTWDLCETAKMNVPMIEEPCAPRIGGEPHALYIALFVAAEFIIGTGMGPVVTIGATYIDDHVLTREASSFYLSFVYAGAALGPVFGYLLGSAMLTLDIEGGLSSVSNFTSVSSDDWKGAWWGGYLFFTFILLQISWIVCMFPKTLPSGRHPVAAASQVLTRSTTLFSLVQDSKSILRCPEFVLVTLASCMQSGVVSGFCIFLPKYLEFQFNVNKPLASTLTGGVAIPAAAAGVIFGGMVNRRFKLNSVQSSRVIMYVGILSLFAFIPLFFLSCSPDPPEGFHLDPKQATLSLLERMKMPKRTNDFIHESSCSAACSCSAISYQPVCDEGEQKSFLSPCIAGCTERWSDGFSNCTCIASGKVRDGLCSTKCVLNFTIFLITIFFMAFCIGNNHLPIILLTMRAVKPHCKSLALALQVVMIRVIAFIPAPIAFGYFIDKTCLRWSAKTCGFGDIRGACMFYDIDRFHIFYVSLACAMQASSCAFLLANYLSVKRPGRRTSEHELDTDCLRADMDFAAAVSVQPMRESVVQLSPRPCHVSYVVA